MHRPSGGAKSQDVDKTNDCAGGENATWDEDVNLRLVMNGFILKNVDFEIMSETASRTSRPAKPRTENWDIMD